MSFSTKVELKQLKNNKIKIRPFQFIPNNISQIKSRIFFVDQNYYLYITKIYIFLNRKIYFIKNPKFDFGIKIHKKKLFNKTKK